jgi:hypothetical protein
MATAPSEITKVELYGVDARKLEEQALTWPERAKAVRITDQESYNAAAELLIAIADLKKQIVEYNADPKKSAYDTWKLICSREKRGLDPLAEGEQILKRIMGTFVQEQERLRLEAQRKADEEARRKEEEARLSLAVEAEQYGAPEETIQEIVNTPMTVQRNVVPSQFAKPAGIGTSHKPVYKWELVNKSQVPEEYKMIDSVKINGIIRAMGNTHPIPGIRIYEDIPNISVRGRR